MNVFFVFVMVLGCAFTSFEAAAEFSPPDIRNNEKTSLEGREYIYIGHASSYWDQTSSSKKGVRELVRFGKSKNIPVVGVIDSRAIYNTELAKKYFLKDQEIDTLIESNAGQHRVSFRNAEKVFFAGGNITNCLCEGIRDVVRGNRYIFGNSPFNLYVVRDAVYDVWNRSFNPVNKRTVEDFVKKNFVPSFKCNQNWYKFPNLRLDNVKMNVFFNDQFVGDYDLEPDSGQSISFDHAVNVHFIHSSDLEKYL